MRESSSEKLSQSFFPVTKFTDLSHIEKLLNLDSCGIHITSLNEQQSSLREFFSVD